MLPYSGIPALPKNIEDMHNQLVTKGLNDVRSLTARISKCEAWKDTVEETELTGNPVTFTNALALPATDCEATLSPIQDLHGYDKPWVGGAGKNIFNFKSALDYWGATYTENSDGSITVTAIGTGYSNPYEFLSTAEIVSMSALSVVNESGASGWSLQIYDETNSVWVRGLEETQLKKENINGKKVRLNFGVNGNGATFKNIQIEKGATATSYAPYSNICPISGRTAVTVDDNNNLFDEVYDNLDTTVRYKPIQVGNGSFTMATEAEGSSSFALLFFLAGNVSSGANSANNGVYSGQSRTVTAINGYVTVAYRNGDVETQTPVGKLTTVVRSTETYTEHSVTIQLGQTVYGGTLNVTSGVLTITHVLQTLNSDLTWIRGGGSSIPTGRAVYYLTEGLTGAAPCGNDDNSNNITMKSNVYNIANKSYNAMRLETGFALGIGGDSNSSTIGCNVSSTDIPDATAFETWLDSNPIEIEYPLATPTTIQLTPTEVQLVAGYNELSSSDADSLTVEAHTGAAWEPITRATKKVTNKTKATKKRRK